MHRYIALSTSGIVLAWLTLFATSSGSTQDSERAADSKANAQELTRQGTNDEEKTTMRLTTYLLLPGTCKEAMTFYQTALGGELVITTIGESPMKAMFPATMHSKVVNARLKSALVDISASDWLRPNQTAVQGNTVCLYLSGGSREETKAVFDKLSDGAQVTDSLTEQPFGLYGALNDKFGNRWMFQSE